MKPTKTKQHSLIEQIRSTDVHTILNTSTPFFIFLVSKSCKSICQLKPQTGFHGDEIATFNWLDKRMLTSEPTTWDGLENIYSCTQTYTQTHRRMQCKWGSPTIYAWLGESHTVSPVRWEAGIECVDTDMVYCQVQAHTHTLIDRSVSFKSVNKAWIKLLVTVSC